MRLAIRILLLLLISVAACQAQLLQGTLNGIVADPSQASVANAQVTVTNRETALTRQTFTSAAGEYTFPTLPPGAYNIKVQAPGFNPYRPSGLRTEVLGWREQPGNWRSRSDPAGSWNRLSSPKSRLASGCRLPRF